METLLELINHTDVFILYLINTNIWLTYLVLFLIIFLESGNVLFPFLPGDGFLFAVGVVASFTPLNIYIIIPLLIIAAILGFIINYQTGKYIGFYLLKKQQPFLLKSYQTTQSFMEKHGEKAVVLARFFPIVRTYVPFVAGAVQMSKPLFYKQSIIGGILWVCTFSLLGFFTGNIPWVQQNYGIIFLGLILTTLFPLVYTVFKKLIANKLHKKR